MSRDRRKTYRVALRPCEQLLITIRPERGLPLLGDVVDLDIHGAGATFSVKPPPLPLGGRLRISLYALGGPRPIDLLAAVVSRADERRVRRYGLEFLAPLHGHLARHVLPLFNGRGRLRVPMDATPAALRDLEEREPRTYKAALRDLSAGGLGLVIPAEAEDHLRQASHLLVRFRLSDDESPLQVVGAVHNRRLTCEGLVYGLELDAARTRHFPEIQERILRFLHQRGLEELQPNVQAQLEGRAA